MAKPWARIEIGYMGHPKFLWLNANAICLWHEGKQYCDMHHTDGLIPRDALKTFRFAGKKSIVALLTTCPTPKPDGTPYAPLWEEHAVGYKMHDYLDHNPCREEVLARMEDADDVAEIRRAANARRQAEYRAKRKAELEVLRSHNVTPTCPTPTDTDTETVTDTKKEERSRPPSPKRLLEAWNAHIVSLPKCEAESEDRLRAARARLREHPDLDWWAGVVARIEASDFLTGRTPGRDHQHWRADVDWFLKPGKAEKVLEGKYDNRTKAGTVNAWGNWRPAEAS